MVAVIIESRSTLDQLSEDTVYSLFPDHANTILRHRKRFRSIDIGVLAASTKRSNETESDIYFWEDESSHSSHSSSGDETASLTSTPPSSITSSTIPSSQQQSRLLSPDHPFKILWDCCTLCLSLFHLYVTHVAIRDRSYGFNWTKCLLELWFVLDIGLNFITEHALPNRRRLLTFQAVSFRYLTTWFWIDVLSLFPGETLFVQPVLLRLQRRRFKIVRRLGRIVQWTRRLIANADVRLVAREVTRQQGLRATTRVARFLIRYIPKYWMFVRNMKAVVGLRMLRQVHWIHKLTTRLESPTAEQQRQPYVDDVQVEDSFLADDEGPPF